jgi:Bacterial regulatory proteins, tetR family
MSDLTDKRSDTTRDQILRAAAHQFAHRPYYAVGLDDILAEAQLTKGAMYFHFRSSARWHWSLSMSRPKHTLRRSKTCSPGSCPGWKHLSTSPI